MVPSAFVALDALPLTPNGKVDRDALPAPDAGRPRRRPTYVAAADAGRGGGRRRLGRGAGASTGSGVPDNFFDLGGHSLLATQVVSRLRDALGVEVPLRAPVRGADRRRPGREADRGRRGRAAGAAAPPIEPRPRDRAGPARRSPSSRSGSSTSSRRASRRSTSPAAVRIAGPLDVDGAAAGLRRDRPPPRVAADDLRRRSTAGPSRSIAPAVDVPLDVGRPRRPARRRPRGRGRAAGRSRRRAGRSTWRAGRWSGRPCSGSATTTTPSSLTMHHIITDGWSFGVAAGELAALYEAFRDGRAVAPARACRSSTPTSPPGSASWLRGEALRRPARLLDAAARGRPAAGTADRPAAAAGPRAARGERRGVLPAERPGRRRSASSAGARGRRRS